MKIFVIAGEASGDLLGASLMRALKSKADVSFYGVGGAAMQAEGLQSLFPMEELSVMGVAEVLPRLPNIIRRINQTVGAVKALKPDAVVTIDSPDFCFRVAKKLRATCKNQPKLIHYVAPSVWAWRAGRAAKIAKIYDHLLTLLPFEPPYFEREGLAATFVGHPVTENMRQGDAAAFRARHGMATEEKLLCVLPGSRASEVTRLGPVFAETLKQMPPVRVVIPTLPHVRALVEQHFGFAKPLIVENAEKDDAFAASNAALAASGTVTLELAVAGVPHVVAYKLNAVSAFLAKRLIRTRFVNLVNIVLGRMAVPELLLENCRPDVLAGEMRKLLVDEGGAQAQREAFAQCLKILGAGEAQTPGMRAADAVLKAVAP